MDSLLTARVCVDLDVSNSRVCVCFAPVTYTWMEQDLLKGSIEDEAITCCFPPKNLYLGFFSGCCGAAWLRYSCTAFSLVLISAAALW